MSKSILDTDILFGYLKGHDRIVTRHGADYATQVLLWLNPNEQIAPTAEDYLQAAIIKAAARKQGSIVELPDCLIASVAVRLGLPSVTGNTEDFQAMRRTGLSLRLENWRNH